MNAKRPSPFHALAILALLALVVVSSGCIKTLQSAMDPVPPTDTTPVAPGDDVAGTIQESQPAPAQAIVTVAELTPSKSAAVEEVAPVLTPDPYPIIHGSQLNQTLKVDPVYSGPYEFEKTYVFRGNATGLRVNVAEGPLYLIYIVTPQNDCLLEPESCRGEKTKPVSRPYLTITVRDNQTHEIVAEDGYGREYSSDTGDYEFILMSKNTDGLLSSGGEIGTNTVTPGPRVLRVFREGVFDITFEGNFLDVDLKVKTGAAASGVSASATPVPALDIPEEEWW
ncbi:hypothetical protein [Methanoregula formicica]|uniref:Uncharacterized protein n=1 Tax=Methanoregula formicica (strain DSM 22288 / NBRC 105244 / SMSP) TaxID=593750 RepID=L0HFU3_METFS|nr:hypothetical protein [Methanoregula formicica]AGB01964.1 hypothetical protein Metfor_0909 [Methanoregula formicica SMSP]